MKKLFVTLLSCCFIASTLVACGSEKIENINNFSEDNTELELNIETDTTGAKNTAPVETGFTPGNYPLDYSLVGLWKDSSDNYMYLDEWNCVSSVTDMTDDFYIDEDNLYINDEVYDVEFDGDFLTCYDSDNDSATLEMRKYDDDNSTYLGEYSITGGSLYKQFCDLYNTDLFFIYITEDRLFLQIAVGEYIAEDGVLTMFNLVEDYSDEELLPFDYSINEDVLTMTGSSDIAETWTKSEL